VGKGEVPPPKLTLGWFGFDSRLLHHLTQRKRPPYLVREVSFLGVTTEIDIYIISANMALNQA